MADTEDEVEVEKKKKIKPKTNSKKKAKLTDTGEPPTAIEVNPELVVRIGEARGDGKAAVVNFGRMNPPTVGHAKLVEKIKSEARKQGATPYVYLSHSQDSKKNPLDYNTKLGIARKAFGSSVTESGSRNIIEVLKELQKKGHNEVTVVVGSDRVKDMQRIVDSYNGKDFTFNKVGVVSAGARDPDAEGVSGMSATKMRNLAQENDVAGFKKGLPPKVKYDADDIVQKIRSGMGLTEEEIVIIDEAEIDEADIEFLEEYDQLNEVLSIQQRRKRGMMMRRIKGKIKRGRKLAQRRLASPDMLKRRARRHAKEFVRKKFAGQRGANYRKLAAADKIQIDRRIEKKQALIDRIAKRLLPKERKAELQRLRDRGKKGKKGGWRGKAKAGIKEEVELDEISAETASSYMSKASDARKHRKLPTKKVDNRYSGVAMAQDKLAKSGNMGTTAQRVSKAKVGVGEAKSPLQKLKDFDKVRAGLGKTPIFDTNKKKETKEEVQLDEANLKLKDFKVGMYIQTGTGAVGKIIANEPRGDNLVVKMNKTGKEVNMNWNKLGLYTKPRLQGLKHARGRMGISETTFAKQRKMQADAKKSTKKPQHWSKRAESADITEVEYKGAASKAMDALNKARRTGAKVKQTDVVKAKIAREKSADRRKHDRMMDRARTSDVKTVNIGEENLFDAVDQLVDYIDINEGFENMLTEKSAPTDPSLWSKAKSLAKSKFDVYPSAYANGWAAKWYKSKGGGWKDA